MTARRFSALLAILLAIVIATPALADLRNTDLFAAYVAGIKDQLREHGYVPGPPGGTLDAQTVRAIEDYQRDAGLPPDGEPSQELLDHLMFARPRIVSHAMAEPQASEPPADEPPTGEPQMDEPSFHDLVSAVQARLIDRGYYTGEIDGVPGPMTIAAVRQFQEDAQIPVDGVIDDALLDRLTNQDPGIRVN